MTTDTIRLPFRTGACMWLVAALVAFLCGANRPASAQTSPTSDAPASAVAVIDLPLNEQLAELRRDLAETKLRLETAMSELERVKAFLETENLDEQFGRWKEEGSKIQEDRLRIQRERHRLEAARKALHQATVADAQRQAEAQAQSREKADEAAKPRWSVQYMLGFIREDNERFYVKVDSSTGRTSYYRRSTDIDKDNVLVRGTFLNRSAEPWRYTFEIRLAGEQSIGGDTPPVIGRWRHQTPLLGPGDLHEFEVKVPVSNSYAVEAVQVGNIKADRPAEQDAEADQK